MKAAETKLKGQELIFSNREKNVKEEEEKFYSRKTYLNVKETNLTKKELIISNQDKIIFKALKTACGLD